LNGGLNLDQECTVDLLAAEPHFLLGEPASVAGHVVAGVAFSRLPLAWLPFGGPVAEPRDDAGALAFQGKIKLAQQVCRRPVLSRS
jgi:hypothetical protein